MFRCLMRARFARSHRATRSTIERVIEEQWCYAEFFRLKLVEDVMRIIRTVVVADSRMVAPNNEMRAPIIFTDQRVEQQSIGNFQRAFLDVFVRAMNRIASLKSNYPPPTAFLKERPGLCGIAAICRKGRIKRTIDETDFSAQQPVALIVESAHSGMSSVSRSVDEFRLSFFIVTILFREVQDGQQMIVLIQRYVLELAKRTRLLVRDRERHWYGPGDVVCQSHPDAHRGVIGPIQKSFER